MEESLLKIVDEEEEDAAKNPVPTAVFHFMHRFL